MRSWSDHHRRVGARGGSALLTALALSVTLAACGGSTGSPGPSGGTSADSGSTSGSTKCVTIAGAESSGSKLNLDPANQPSSQSALYVDATHDRLLTKDNNFRVGPSLATSYRSNASGTEWVFQLRHDVKFQDGKPFTSADVVYTYRRLLDPKSNSESLSSFSQFLTPKGIQPVGKYAVKFIAKEPTAELPMLITTKNTWIVQDGASTADIKSGGAGTGPFIPVGFRPVQRAHQFKRNPSYWRTGYPKAACLTFLVVQESASANAAIETGQVDVLQSADPSTADTLKSNPNINLLVSPPGTAITLAMQIDKPPYNDVRVRRALKAVVNRQQMVDTALFGYGAAGDDNPTPPTSPDAWRPQAPQQDIAGAKRLLQQAGYGPGHPLKVTLYSGAYIPGALQVAQLYKQMAAQAGIQINLITTPASTYFSTTWPQQVFRGSAWGARPPGVSLPLEYTGRPPLDGNNDSNWKNAAFDALLKKAPRTLDAAARQAIYQQAEKMLTLDGGVITPVFSKTIAAVRKNCTGYALNVDVTQYDFASLTCG